MNWKVVTALFALVALATSAAVFGACGEDDCSRSQDKLTQCQMSMTSSASSSTSGMPMTLPCVGTVLCEAQCYNNATCDQINGNLPVFTCCVNCCKGGGCAPGTCPQ